jgi:UDP-glucose:(heptosyl)LPS alpha-1,3-glucosyltransferase
LNNKNKFALIIYKYFPYGGAQRDMLHLAKSLTKKGHDVEIITMNWDGEKPSNKIKIHILKSIGLFNYLKYKNFHRQALEYLKQNKDLVSIAFSKLSGFNFYYAADSCFKEKNKNSFKNFLPRNKFFLEQEELVFKKNSATKILSISERENQIYQSHFGTEEERFIFVPPFIDKKFFISSGDENNIGEKIFGNSKNILLFIGSGFKTKGLDRAIQAFSKLPDEIMKNFNFLIIGKDNPKKYLKTIKKIRLTSCIKIIPGYDDIPKAMRESCALIHPARNENTGLILLEALSQSLPIITTDRCGYSPFVKKDKFSKVLDSPFSQIELNKTLLDLVSKIKTHKKLPNKYFQQFNKYLLDQLILKNL